MIFIKALILAAGYATRLYPLTKNQPKPLLRVGGKAIVDHIVEKIQDVPSIGEVFVVTNDRFYTQFKDWADGYKENKIRLINDGTKNNEDRLGAVGDLSFVLQNYILQDDLLVIAGDNLFGFSLKDFIYHFTEKQAPCVAFHDLKDLEAVKGRYGVGLLNGTRVVDFQEKPQEPCSTLASTACYLFPQQLLPLITEYVAQGIADNPGDLIQWLAGQTEVHGFVFDEHWFDIGSYEGLQQAREVYGQ